MIKTRILPFFFLVISIEILSVESVNRRKDIETERIHAQQNLLKKAAFRSERSTKDDFPCPEEALIEPCSCWFEWGSDNIYLDCSLVTSEAEIENVFSVDFPVKHYNYFLIRESEYIDYLNFTTNGVEFEKFWFSSGPFTLNHISNSFLIDSANVLKEIYIEDSQLTTEGFPFSELENYPVLEILNFLGSSMESVPRIKSDSLAQIHFPIAQISSIESGTFNDVPQLKYFFAWYNSITELKAGTFPVTNHSSIIDFGYNALTSIETGAFFDNSPNNDAYIYFLDLNDNSLTELKSRSIPLTGGGDLEIDLSDNQLTTIAPDAFLVMSEPVPGTLLLYLSNNQLTIIDEEVFRPLMPYFERAAFGGNPLLCGCDIAWLVFDESLMDKIGNSATCADGTKVHDLDPDLYASFC